MTKKKNVRRKRNPPKRQRRKAAQRRGAGGKKAPRVSEAGKQFLMCALAAPDFSVSAFAGVPDTYSGRVVTKRYETTASLATYATAGQDLYLMSSNVPGIAFFYLTRTSASTGAAAWVPVEYPDTNTLLPQDNAAKNVSAFRFASSQLEIVNTTNAMAWTGSIQVFRSYIHDADVNEPVTGAAGGTALRKALVGDNVINSVKPEAVIPFNLGAYAVARNVDPTYPFQDIVTDMEFSDFYQTGGNLFNTSSATTAQFTGFGTMETIIYKIPSWSATGNVGLLRAWACVEYQVDSSSALYDYSHMSPAYDPVALHLMAEYSKVMPPAVTYRENASFWKTFLAWLGKATSAIAPTLGVYSPLAAGVGVTMAAASEILE